MYDQTDPVFFLFWAVFIAKAGRSWYNHASEGGDDLKRNLLAFLLTVCFLLCSFPGTAITFSGPETPSPLPSASPADVSEPADTAVLPQSLPSSDGFVSRYVPNPEWERKFTNYYNATGSKTGVFIVTLRGKPLLIFVRGSRDTHKNPTELTTAFKIASVTKMVTAIGFMQLAEQGFIGLDEPINNYLPFRVVNPACPEADITMRQILSHTSTLKQSSKYLPDWENLPVSNSVFYRNLLPGEKYHYANLNGGLVGSMIEALSGQSVNTYMKEHVFDPLGIDAAYSPTLLSDQENIGALMTRSGVTTSNASRQLKADADYDDTCDPAIHTDRTAGALYISADGLNRLMVMMANGGVYEGVRILKEETVRLMEQDQSLIPDSSVTGSSAYGLFLTHYNFGGSDWYGHQGRFNGLTSDAFYQPDTGLTFVMIVNGYSGKSNDGLANLARKCMTYIDTWELEADNGI